MSSAGMRTCMVLGMIALAIGLTNGDKIDTPIPCVNTSDCRSMPTLPGDAFCKNGFCMCPRVDTDIQTCSSINASMHKNKSSGPLVYRTCKHDQDCNFLGGICNNTIHQCVCLKNYVPSSNKQHCIKKINSIEASCTDKNQCSVFLANTTCEDNKCVCVSGYHYVDNACWKVVKYNEPCTKNQECSHIEGGICTDNMTCGCPAEMVLNVDGKKCLAAARKIRDECTESIQCMTTFEFSTCVDKMCQCKENFHYEHELTRCFPNKAIGDECANKYECYQAEDYENDLQIKSVMCNFNTCMCADNYILSENKCVSADCQRRRSFEEMAGIPRRLKKLPVRELRNVVLSLTLRYMQSPMRTVSVSICSVDVSCNNVVCDTRYCDLEGKYQEIPRGY